VPPCALRSFPSFLANRAEYITSLPGAQHRFPRYFSLDLRASKDIQVTPNTLFGCPQRDEPDQSFQCAGNSANVADPQYGRFFDNINRKVLFDFHFLFYVGFGGCFTCAVYGVRGEVGRFSAVSSAPGTGFAVIGPRT